MGRTIEPATDDRIRKAGGLKFLYGGGAVDVWDELKRNVGTIWPRKGESLEGAVERYVAERGLEIQRRARTA